MGPGLSWLWVLVELGMLPTAEFVCRVLEAGTEGGMAPGPRPGKVPLTGLVASASF